MSSLNITSESYLEHAAAALEQAQAAYDAALAAVTPKRVGTGRRRMAAESAERITGSALNDNDGFSLLKKPAPVVQRGYDMRIQRIGSTWMNEQAHAWAPAGELPAEWTAITQDPSVLQAVCFPSTQRTWRADRRRNVAEYTLAAVAI